VQLDQKINKLLFNNIIGDFSNYFEFFPHGFISSNVVLPACFCELGIDKFINDLENNFNIVKADILNSLIYKIKSIGDSRLVIPRIIKEKYNL
jgi:hypothetical protein